MTPASWLGTIKIDQLGRMNSPIHRIDARAKALTTFFFIITVVSFAPHEVSALTPFTFYPLFLLLCGKIPFRAISHKLLIALPFALLIGLFNPFFDRELHAIGARSISGGWLSFGSILFRFLLTASAALILMACTGMNRLCSGLEQLGLPQILTTQLLFLYRYLSVISEEAAAMLLAFRLRNTAKKNLLPLAIYGSLIGHLLLRSMDRAERIHQAMCARGFEGSIQFMHQTPFKRSDALFVISWLLFFIVARCFNLAQLLGAFCAGSIQ